MLSFHHVTQFTGAHAINGLLEGVALTAFASAFLWIISCRNSGTRFAVWFSTLLAVAGLSLTALIPAETGAIAAKTPHLILPAVWADYALGAWAVIALTGLLRIAIGVAQVWRLRRNCQDVPDSTLDPNLRKILEDFRSVRRVKLCASDRLRVPAAVGFLNPAVVLPRWAIDDLSPAELKAVVLHELGHLRRRDDWTNLAQQILRAMLFFHPGVWWIDSRLNLEREMACDDLVLAGIGNAHSYAECLVSVAEKSAVRTRMALALAAVSRMRQTALRLARILDGNRLIDTRMSRAAVSTVAAVSALALFVLPYTPALVTLQTSAQIAQSGSAHTVAAPGWTATPAQYTGGRLSPQIVQAAMHYSSIRADNHPLTKKLRHRQRQIHVAPKRSLSPQVIRTAFRREEMNPSPTLLLVVQMQEYFSDDSPSWTVCVWRVTVVPNASVQMPVQIQNGTVSKSI